VTDALNATKAAVEEGIVPGNVSFKVHGMFMLISFVLVTPTDFLLCQYA
jgi:chaperonin GroEL (HSP60 family)